MDIAIIVLSWVGTCLTGITWIPQCYRVFKTRETDSISLLMMIIIFLASIVWILFGAFSQQWAILVTNSLVLVAVTLILLFKIYNLIKKKEKVLV
ncbi:SemiSWEET family sugar transporter [Spiroplasma platyhelix]|uniref:MtN3 and saliva related transmembrane protein n=1 Tax=Spiroplasma platyhelix PALS-1 TaxID=1276218 RepID=A0A846U459_9MOLU|nr:SemiSWEET family transporter [Spiroplasma platyhelix]MBE4703874.1 Sugar transporter SemiSWEET [Spiroplasma platyhelix PALS-1]NKE38247.1 hypothetical protein [Spiroplasma platyhelix PALS-1]UJB29132.1 hypothetical protein SPLAT_v1c03680 [Spiroplasma platyhelix PALS-1]